MAVALCLLQVGTRRPHFVSTKFVDILDERSSTANAYTGVPLADLPTTTRARVLTTLARRVDEERHADAIFERPHRICGTRVDGTKRPRSQSGYSWLRDGTRVACKSAQLRWDTNRWVLTYHKVHLAIAGTDSLFDELMLVAYTPRGIYLLTHDTVTGVSMHSRLTSVNGHEIVFRGPQQESRWEEALDGALLSKLRRASCDAHLGFVRFDDARLISSLEEAAKSSATSVAYTGVPLADYTPATRGILLKKISRRVDSLLNPAATIIAQPAGPTKYSWSRDGTRVLCKSAQLSWDRRTRRWMLQFSDVKLEHERAAASPHFDELWLMAYTPRGLYLYRHDLKHGVTTNGKHTTATGKHMIKLVGPMGVAGIDAALDTLLAKLDMSCEPLAFVSWPDRQESETVRLSSDRVDFWAKF